MIKNLILISILIISAVLLFLADAESVIEEKDIITISAAASLQGVFEELELNFEHEHPDIELNMNYASSGSLRVQIEQGAPVDIFASASLVHMDILEKNELIVNNSRMIFTGNQLVIIVPKDGKNITLKNIIDTRRIAIGAPSHVPAGKYAKEVMEREGIWNQTGDNISNMIFAINVKQVLDYVKRGEVDAGFVYSSDVNDMVMTSQIIPPDHYSPILYPIAIIKDGAEHDIETKFIEFVIQSDEVFLRHGFTDANKIGVRVDG